MKPNWKTLFILTTCCTLGLMTTVRAQVSSDGTLSTTVTNPDNLNFTINNGNRVGGNLFHSFREFSVPNGGSAVFQNALDVQNIINRVTGGSLSQINGLIQSQGSANLFLLNPAGIFFGPNARLNIGGSFFATTADSLLFDNGFEFSATNPQAPPLLTVNIPVGLRFRDNPSNITNASSNFGLKVPSGQTLALVGGNVSMDGGQLNAYSGRVELGGLAEPGTLALSVDGDNLSLRFPDNVKRASVSLTNRSGVFVSGAGGGNIAVNAKNLDILGGSILSAGIGEGLGTPETVAGDIALNAVGTVTINQASRLSNTVADNATGNAGNINIKAAGDISINNLGRLPALNAGSSGRGRSGNVSLQANGSIFVSGESLESVDSVISTFSEGQSLGSGDISLNASGGIFLNNAFFGAASFGGNGGNISLQGNNEISLANNSSLVSAAFTRGSSGSITLNSTGPISIQNTLVNTAVGEEGSNTTQVGNAGNINISGRSVSLTGGSEISSRSFSGVNSGNINVNATEFVEISGNAPEIPRPESDRANSFPYTTLATTSEQFARGASGNITVNTPNLRISDGASVRADTRSNSIGGSVNINANVVDITSGGQIFTTAFSTGNAGNIQLIVRDRLNISGSNPSIADIFNQIAIAQNRGRTEAEIQLGSPNSQAGIFANSSGTGQGGNLSITGNTLNLDRGVLSASTASGDGGNINLNLRNFIRLRNESLISADARGQQVRIYEFMFFMWMILFVTPRSLIDEDSSKNSESN